MDSLRFRGALDVVRRMLSPPVLSEPSIVSICDISCPICVIVWLVKEDRMRADRLLSLLTFLQNRGRTTTDRLANELEVSRRTIIRDLYALRVAGFPVYTERGPYGGVYLHEDFRVRLTDLTPDELAALFTFSVPAPLADLGMGVKAKGALLKLAAALPQTRQGVERDVRSRLYLDPNPWHASRELVPTLSTLRQAVWEDRWLRAMLLRARQIPVEHEIAPYGLVAKGRVWYVIWRRRNGELRVDRASDVIEARLMEDYLLSPSGIRPRGVLDDVGDGVRGESSVLRGNSSSNDRGASRA